MAKVTISLKKAVNLRSINKSAHGDIAKSVVDEMKRMILSGISPVKGVRRFVQYAAVRNKNQKDYPFSVKNKFPQKSKTPVNLTLSGQFLDTLSYKANDKGSTIGHIDPSRRTRDLFESHNDGLNKRVPQRKYLPNIRGEEYSVSIMRLIKKLYSDTIKKILS